MENFKQSKPLKSKQIEKLLHGVISNFCEDIFSENVIKIIKEDSFITGGCIPSMMLGEWVNDYDFYFTSKEAANVVKEYFKSKMQHKDLKYKVKAITDNAVTLDNKIQLITAFTGSPSEVASNFDWAHIKSYYTFNEGLKLCDDLYRLIVEKELVYTGSVYPLSSLFRLKKYIRKGWNVSNATILHVALDVVEALKGKKVKARTYVAGFDEDRVDDQNIIIEDNESMEGDEPIEFDVDTLIHQLNGVDPITVQHKLAAFTGKHLSIKEIIDVMNSN